ncbi:MAG: hypothetical protein FVQ79_02505 [Planctomycetes bacterium]|nr:hypothetical protein [Planctomycetota bacterium]
MQVRNTLTIIFCVTCSLALLLTASLRLDSIHSAREDLDLVSNVSIENAPPGLAFATVAMGAFRGIVVDILWMRADKLKEEGQFFDAKQLAEWITTLQPRFAAVWDFQAWNMAYNISVAMPASQWEERWRWVRNGYELLRDKGIPQNPHSILLYRSLAWIFQHKIGGVSDECHKDYKRELAFAMRSILKERTRKSPLSQQDFLDMVESQQSLVQAMQDPEVARLVNGLRDADERFRDNSELAGNYISLRQVPERFEADANEVISDFMGTEALSKFDVFSRTWLLRNKWKMDPAFMYELNEKYGPIDGSDLNDHLPLNWEHADAHAIYWAEQGLKTAGKKGVYSIDEKNTDRIVFHSLKALFLRGKLIIYPVDDGPPSVFLRPDLTIFDGLNRIWIEKIEKYEALEKSNPKAVRGGHKNMLENATLLFYQAGHIKKSGEIYNELRKRYMRSEYEDGLLVFVQKQMREEIKDLEIHDARELLLMSLREAYFQYAVGEDDMAAAREDWAKQLYDMYVREFGDYAVRRVNLPSFSMARYLAFMDFINDPYYPRTLQRALMGRIQVERPDLFDELEKQEQQLQKRIEEEQKKTQPSVSPNY